MEELRYPANGLRIVFDSGERVEPALYADIEQSFMFVDASGKNHHVDMNEPSSLGVVLAIAGQTVNRVSTEDAVLSLQFSDGSSLRCAPDPQFEAWQVVGGRPQFLVVCCAAGEGLAVWDENTPPLMSNEVKDRLPRLSDLEDRRSAT